MKILLKYTHTVFLFFLFLFSFLPNRGEARGRDYEARRLETRDKSGEHRSVHDCRCQVIDFAIGERNLTLGRRHKSIQDV